MTNSKAERKCFDRSLDILVTVKDSPFDLVTAYKTCIKDIHRRTPLFNLMCETFKPVFFDFVFERFIKGDLV